MEYQPIFRDTLQKLKSIKDEELRIKKINTTIDYIHNKVIKTAETTNDNKYYYQIPVMTTEEYNRNTINRIRLPDSHPSSKLLNEFYNDNLHEIIIGLQNRFPDCSIKQTSMVQDEYGRLYDIMHKMSEVFGITEYILVDWSP